MSVDLPSDFPGHDEADEPQRPCAACGDPDGDVCSCLGTALEVRPSPGALDAPVRPWFTGTRMLGGIRTTMGLEAAKTEAVELLRLRVPLAVDIETEGKTLPRCDRVHVVGIGTGDRVILLDPRDPRQAELIRLVLEAAVALVFHNSPYDVPILYRRGLFRRDWVAKVIDTLIYARMAWPARTVSKSLEDLGVRLLGMPAEVTNWTKAAAKAEKLAVDKMYQVYDIDRPVYVIGNAADVAATARLLPVVRESAWTQLTANHPYTEYGVTGDEATRMLDREQVINRGRLRRTLLGYRVDFEFADRFADRFAGELDRAAAIMRGFDVKPGDSASLVRWADAQGFIPPPDRHPRLKSGAPSGEKKYLERIPSPLVKLFLAHKGQTKIMNDYLVKIRDLSVGGRVYPVKNIFGASTTGRASTGSPPLDQFPDGARGMILAEDGDPWTSLDWRQIEPVTAANVAGDMGLLREYEAGTGDPYETIASMAGITRKSGKVVILADMYGQGLALMCSNLGCDIDTGRDIKAAARSGYAVTAQHFERIKAAAEEYRLVPTVSGRILPVQRQQDEKTGKWRVATHMAVNYHVQGSAYDLLAEALYETERQGLGDQVHLTMHDELVISTAVAQEVQQIMRTPPAALCRLAKRTPVLHTDRNDLGERWAYV